MQGKDLQAEIADLKSEQKVIEATAKENHELVLEASLDDTGKITDIRVVRGIASLTELTAAVDLSCGKARRKAGVLTNHSGLVLCSA